MADKPKEKRGASTSGVVIQFFEHPSLPTGNDLEWALRAAEQLLARAEERRRHEHNRFFAVVSVMAGTIISLFASLVAVVEVITFSNAAMRIVVTTFPVAVSSVVLLLSARALRRYQQEGELDMTMRLATQISSMVGDAMLDVAAAENWSYLRVEAMKLRLSAFPLVDRPRRFGGW
ncbi:hypothetical protein ACFUEN_02050 [Streptomyces griseorubiginosus]|uniref:hypothetical protein n=1 Tax=Streptomyces griseorubiginosus TaxID=67304 RepID=UPI0036301D1A